MFFGSISVKLGNQTSLMCIILLRKQNVPTVESETYQRQYHYVCESYRHIVESKDCYQVVKFRFNLLLQGEKFSGS